MGEWSFFVLSQPWSAGEEEVRELSRGGIGPTESSQTQSKFPCRLVLKP